MQQDSKKQDQSMISPEWFPIRDGEFQQGDNRFGALRNIPLFRDLRLRDWRELSGFFHERHYESGEIIFKLGTPGLGMYVIIEGTVRIVLPQGDSYVEFARLGPNDFFGELSLIDAHERSASAISQTPTFLIGIFRPQLEELMKRRPKLGVIILKRLASIISYRLRETNRMLVESRTQNSAQNPVQNPAGNA